MLGVGGAGGFGFFFLLELRLEAVPTRLRWDFFFLVFRDSELLVPEEESSKRVERRVVAGERKVPPHAASGREPLGPGCLTYLDPTPDSHSSWRSLNQRVRDQRSRPTEAG